MDRDNNNNKKNVLVVVRWPLGGIRTHMRYVYKYLASNFHITILACSTQEDEALKKDASEIGANLLIYASKNSDKLYRRIHKELASEQYDIIQSHGFISALHVYLANFFSRVPHVLTVHGILEERRLKGLAGKFKMAVMAWVIKHVDVLYAVSEDILGHLLEKVPSLESARCKKVVISNGIDVTQFGKLSLEKGAFRKQLGIRDDVFLIGFLGRFMQQKGFNYLIDAVEILEKSFRFDENVKVLAVGSGDYLDWYQKVIKEKGLEHRFICLPFQQDVSAIYRDIDVVVMPSLWEACPLQPMEAMCAGTPIIVSDCIGLREVVKDTPAIVFESQNSRALAEALADQIQNPQKDRFLKFRPIAIERFNVQNTAREVDRLFRSLIPGA